jgi:hypothetical protein
VVCILLATTGMSFAVVAALGIQSVIVPHTSPHLRPEIALRPLVEQAAQRSPSIRELIDRIEAADVIVYVRLRQFTRSDLNGRVALLSSMPAGQRYLVVELACGRSDVITIAALGHELFHALEIAAQPSIVDGRSMAAFYTTAGEKTGDQQGQVTFETRGAEAAGVQVRRELIGTPARQTWTLK